MSNEITALKSPHLGKTVVDKITGFRGIVSGHCIYITGCDQLLVQPQCKEDDISKVPSAAWIDINRLDVQTHEPVLKLNTTTDLGSMDAAPVK